MVIAMMETIAETKEGVTELTGLIKDMLEEVSATHEDVRYVPTSVTMLARTDVAHEARDRIASKAPGPGRAKSRDGEIGVEDIWRRSTSPLLKAWSR
jgi:hypothetical protein